MVKVNKEPQRLELG
jgi:hypothetical protein